MSKQVEDNLYVKDSIFLSINAFTNQHTSSFFFDNRLLNEPEWEMNGKDNRLAFTKYTAIHFSESLRQEAKISVNSVRSKVYWVNNTLHTLNLTIEQYEFKQFNNKSELYSFVLDMYERYEKISGESAFHIFVGGYLTASNIITKPFMDFFSDYETVKLYDKLIIQNFNNYRRSIALLTNNK